MTRKKKQICVNGHDTFVTGRYSDNSCKECKKEKIRTEESKEYHKEYYETNKEDILEKMKEYYLENAILILLKKKEYTKEHKEEKNEYNKQYYIEHRDGLIQAAKDYYEANIEKILQQNKIYRSSHPELCRLLHLKGKVKRGLRVVKWGQEGILEFYINCFKSMRVDHIIPLCGKYISGLHVIWNLQYLTPEDNAKKFNKCDLLEASEEYGKLLEQAGLK